jgi:hypothetical protein
MVVHAMLTGRFQCDPAQKAPRPTAFVRALATAWSCATSTSVGQAHLAATRAICRP